LADLFADLLAVLLADLFADLLALAENLEVFHLVDYQLWPLRDLI